MQPHQKVVCIDVEASSPIWGTAGLKIPLPVLTSTKCLDDYLFPFPSDQPLNACPVAKGIWKA